MFLLKKKIRNNSIGIEGTKELAKGLRTLINLNSLTINLQ